MITTEDKTIYLARGATDMRKQINGLIECVVSVFGMDAFTGSLFVFCNRAKNIIRILEWDSDGFWLHTKRLERGRFMWPTNHADDKTIDITGTELMQILSATVLERRLLGEEVTERQIH